MHLQARKQRHKLQMFQRLWRILVISVIAVAAFFVVSSMSLSNRMNEGKPFAGECKWNLGTSGKKSDNYLQIILLIAGDIDGSCWMVLWLPYTYALSQPLLTYGVQ